MNKSHYETIICPSCNSIELANIEHTIGLWTYQHVCPKCNKTIGRDEWYSTGHLHHSKMEDILFQMKTGSVPIIATDPPYGVRTEKEFEWDAEADFKKNIRGWLYECLRVAEYTVIWHCAGKMLPFIFEDKMLRKKFHRLHFWEKPSGSQYNGASHNNIWYNIEPILVFSNNVEATTANYSKDVSYAYDNLSYPTVAKSKYGHPTTKPLGEIVDLVLHYSKEGQTVLDPFAGSGTLAEACIKTKRKYICIEQDDTHFNGILKRINLLNSQIGMFNDIEQPTKNHKKDKKQEVLL